MKSSGNSKENTDSPFNVLEKIRQYIFENLLSVLWTVSLLVGGIIFWLYFYDIQYFPDLDFDESVLLLLVAAITGGYILVITALVFMSPYIIRGVLKATPPSNKEMASDNELGWYFASFFLVYLAFLLYFYLEYKYKISCLSFGIPSLIVLVIILGHFRVYSSLYDWIERILQWIKRRPQWILQWIKQILPNACGSSDKKNDEKEPKDINMIWAWIWSIIFMLLILGLILEPIVDEIEQNEVEKLILCGVLLGGIIAGNFLFAIFQESTKKTLWRWTIPILMVFFVFFFAGKPVTSQIPKIVMKKYKFGNFTAQRLLVDEKGCEILKGFNLISGSEIDQKTCSLENIKILSRVGRSFYLKKTRQNIPPLCFTIPSEQVLSWSIEPDKQKKAGKDKKEAIPCE